MNRPRPCGPLCRLKPALQAGGALRPARTALRTAHVTTPPTLTAPPNRATSPRRAPAAGAAPPSLQQQQRQADPHDPERDERASQDDARGGREDAGPVRPDADFESLAEELIERAAPGDHVAPLERTVAVVLHDPAFGAHADLDVSCGLRRSGRLRRDGHGEVEAAVPGLPVDALPAEQGRLTERRDGVEPDLRFHLAVPSGACPDHGEPFRGQLPREGQRGVPRSTVRKQVSR